MKEENVEAIIAIIGIFLSGTGILLNEVGLALIGTLLLLSIYMDQNFVRKKVKK